MENPDVSPEAEHLADAEFLWLERFRAFQARARWHQETAGIVWNEPQKGGEKIGHLGAQYLASLKTCRTIDSISLWPLLVSWDEKAYVYEQVTSLQMPQNFKGWKHFGRTESSWKIENGGLWLWTNRAHAWAEVRDSHVLEKVLQASAFDLWIELLGRQVPLEIREAVGSRNGRVQLAYETTDIDLGRIWGDTTHFRIPAENEEGQRTPLHLTVDLSKIDGRVDCISLEIPDASGRICRFEKVFFDQNFTP